MPRELRCSPSDLNSPIFLLGEKGTFNREKESHKMKRLNPALLGEDFPGLQNIGGPSPRSRVTTASLGGEFGLLTCRITRSCGHPSCSMSFQVLILRLELDTNRGCTSRDWNLWTLPALRYYDLQFDHVNEARDQCRMEPRVNGVSECEGRLGPINDLESKGTKFAARNLGWGKI